MGFHSNTATMVKFAGMMVVDHTYLIDTPNGDGAMIYRTFVTEDGWFGFDGQNNIYMIDRDEITPEVRAWYIEQKKRAEQGYSFENDMKVPA